MYVYGLLPNPELFKTPVMVITWLIFITTSCYMGFLCDIFQLSEESLNNCDLYNTDVIRNFSCSVNYNSLDCEPGHTEEFPNS